MIGASSIGTPTMLITRPIRWGPAACPSSVCPSGRIMPPPSPCTTREPISWAIEVARPASSEPSMNRASADSHTRFAPNRSPAQPVSGITLANASQ